MNDIYCETFKVAKIWKPSEYTDRQININMETTEYFIVHSYHELSVLQLSQVCDSCTEGMTMRKVTDGLWHNLIFKTMPKHLCYTRQRESGEEQYTPYCYNGYLGGD